MNAVALIKFIGTWICIILTCLCLGHIIVGPAEVFAILSIAFAQAPSTW